MANDLLSDEPAARVNIDSARADAETVDALFQTILGRPINDDRFKAENDGTKSVRYWVQRLVNSQEFKNTFLAKHNARMPSENYISDATYRVPSLSKSNPPSLVLVTGSCMTESWKRVIENAYPETEIRHQLFNNASELEDIAEDELRKANFQIVQIPIRSIVSESEYFSVSLSEEGRTQVEKMFQSSVARVRRNLDAALKYNRAVGITTFVLNFAKPQANPIGRMLPKYDLFNFSYYVDELNRELYRMIEAEQSVYMIDYDEITATLGKRFIQDDLISHVNHGSFLGGTHGKYDIHLTPPGPIDQMFEPKKRDAILAIFNECVAAYDTILPNTKIKIVIFDLDGTLWRGVPADHDEIGGHLTEGWPTSILEAAAFLKKRGILLALASKNDPEVAKSIWTKLYEKRFPLSNFVSAKFSWSPKVESIAEILKETNLLPGNCLFVDDNPLEREQAQIAFPDLKVISGPIYNWRRTLLWGTELQVPYVTKESIARTESIQSMIQREVIRSEVNEDDYLSDLKISILVERIDRVDHKKFPRAFELLNKTNQFNMTGRRWTEQEMLKYFAEGGSLHAADVSDRLTDYGLTAVMLSKGNECTQIVMSCRIFGLRVEFAVVKTFLESSGAAPCLLFLDTGKNKLCRKFLEKLTVSVPVEPIIGDAASLCFPDNYVVSPELTAPVTVQLPQIG